MLTSLSILAVSALLAAIFLGWVGTGKWRQRALYAERKNKADRKAHDIQNRIVFDPTERERVRRKYDNP